MWIATAQALLHQNDALVKSVALPPTLAPSTIRNLYESHRSGLLVSSLRGGLWSCPLEGSAKGCTPIPGVGPDSKATVYSIHEDSKGVLWLAASLGLGRLAPGSPKIEWYDLKPFLSTQEREFYQVAEDSKGRLWLAGRRSLVRLDKLAPNELRASAVHQFDRRDGMLSANFGVARQGWRSPNAPIR